jgi:site-specific recombinase XerD
MLRAHFDKFKLWKNNESIIFPSYTKTKGLDWSKGLTVSQLRSLVKDAANQAGLNGSTFGAHSMRAGGATDLFRLGVYYPNIKKFGRWKSDTALIYYRDQEVVVDAVMKAFGSLTHTTD